MERCNQPIPCGAFNNDGSMFAYSVCLIFYSNQVKVFFFFVWWITVFCLCQQSLCFPATVFPLESKRIYSIILFSSYCHSWNVIVICVFLVWWWYEKHHHTHLRKLDKLLWQTMWPQKSTYKLTGFWQKPCTIQAFFVFHCPPRGPAFVCDAGAETKQSCYFEKQKKKNSFWQVCYDWSKGAENHNPATAKTHIFIHLPEVHFSICYHILVKFCYIDKISPLEVEIYRNGRERPQDTRFIIQSRSLSLVGSLLLFCKDVSINFE